MPRYEYRCRACGSTFEISRPMSASGELATCPHGHDDTVKLLSTVALTGGGGARSAGFGPGAAGYGAAGAGGGMGGGCCGGSCGCG